MDGQAFNPAGVLGRREVLRALAVCLADLWLPRRLFAQTPPRFTKPDRRVIVVTFGGGVRYEDTLAPQGWVNIPHLANQLIPKGLVYPVARYEGLTGHFNSTAAMATGNRQDVDAYGGEAPLTPTIFELFRKERGLPSEETWIVATNKSFGLMGGSKLKIVRRSLRRQCRAPQAASDRHHQIGRNCRPRRPRPRPSGAGRTDDVGAGRRIRRVRMEGARIRACPQLGAESQPREVVARLFQRSCGPNQRRRADVFHDQRDHEPVRALVAARQLLGYRHRALRRVSLYLDAIRRTDRLVYELWRHAQSLPDYRDRTTLLVVPELGRDGDVAGNGFANHRSGDDTCRRVWVVAMGAGAPAGAGTERPVRTSDVAPTVAGILGFKIPECEGRPLVELVF